MFRDFLLIFFLYTTICCAAYGQPIYTKDQVKLFTVKDGLPNDWIEEVFEDRYGFIWIGTENGLCRYDGHEFTTIQFDADDVTGLPKNRVFEIVEDLHGYLWIGMHKALARLDPMTLRFKSYFLGDDDTNLPTILSMKVDLNGYIWIFTSQGIYLNSKGLVFKKISDIILVSAQKYAQGMLIKTKVGLFYWEGQWPKPKLINHLNLLPIDTEFQPVFIDHVSTHGVDSSNVLSINNEKFIRSSILNKRGSDDYYMANDKLWTYNFASKSSRQVVDVRDIVGDHSGFRFIDWFVDHNKNIWICTSRGLIFINYRKPVFQKFSAIHARDIKVVDSSIWIGGVQGLFEYSYDGHIKKQWNKLRIASFDVSKEYVFGGTPDNTIFRIDLKLQKHFETKIYSPEKTIINTYFTGVQAGRVIFGSAPYLVQSNLRLTEFDYYEVKDSNGVLHPDVVCGLWRSNNELWLGTVTGGAFVFNTSEKSIKLKKQIKHIPGDSKSLSSKVVMDIYEDKNLGMILGTESGLTVFDETGNFKYRWLKKDGLSDQKIMSTQTDFNGLVWLSTIGHGLMRWIPPANHFQVFTENDGIPSNNFLFSSSARDSRGRLLFGTDKGVLIFDPVSIPIEPEITDTVYLTYCMVNDLPFYDVTKDSIRNILFLNDIKLKFDQNKISFILSQPRKSSIVESDVKYQLKSVDQNWLKWKPGEKIIYDNLPYGEYKLIINQNGYIHTVLQIIISPPWFKTLIAKFVFIGLFLLCAYWVIRKLIRNQLQQQKFRHDKEILQTRAHYFSNLIHELKTPLQLIQGPIQLVQQKLNHGITQREIESLLITATKNTERISTLVLQMETLQKIDQSIIQQEASQININEFAKAVLYSFESKNTNLRLKLEFKSSIDDDGKLSIDSSHVTSILYNLIQNSFDHAIGASAILLQLNLNYSKLEVIVSDDGPGIPLHDQPYVFDRFYTKSLGNRGSGLGLALVKELVTWYGGEVHYQDAVPHGSIFKLWLPVTGTEETEDHRIENAQRIEVIIVEDEPSMAEFIFSCLPKSYAIKSFSSARLAWSHIISSLPDLILTDRIMPDWDGVQFSKEVKSNELTSHIPIIMISGLSDVESRVLAYQSSIDLFLPKPFSVNELQQVVAQILENRQKIKKSLSNRLSDSDAIEKYHDPFVEKLINLIDMEMSKGELNVDQICQKMTVSRTQLFRKCTSCFDLSIHQIITQKRLARAKKLLITDPKSSVSDIALACGMKDPNYFGKFFKKETDLTPSEYRQLHIL